MSPGGVPEWPKGSDCKSDVVDFGGSNPPPSTININLPDEGLSGGDQEAIDWPEVLDRRSEDESNKVLWVVKTQILSGNSSVGLERQPSKLRVAGSSPVSRSIKKNFL